MIYLYSISIAVRTESMLIPSAAEAELSKYHLVHQENYILFHHWFALIKICPSILELPVS